MRLRSGMNHQVYAVHGGGNEPLIADVPLDKFEFKALKIAHVARIGELVEHPQTMPGGDQVSREVGPDEAGSACEKCAPVHGGRIPHFGEHLPRARGFLG